MQRIGEGKDEPGGKDILTSVGDPIINLYQRRVANSHSLYKGETNYIGLVRYRLRLGKSHLEPIDVVYVKTLFKPPFWASDRSATFK